MGQRERSSAPNGLRACQSCHSRDETGLSLWEGPSQELRALGEGHARARAMSAGAVGE